MRKRRKTAEVLLSKKPKSSKRPSWMALERPPIWPEGLTLEESVLWCPGRPRTYKEHRAYDEYVVQKAMQNERNKQ